MMERIACAHCGLPLAARRERPAGPSESARAAPRFCCSGCSFAYRLAGRHLDEDGGASGDPLLARIVLSAVLGTGVMVFSLASYGEFLPTGDSAGGTEAAQALRGLYRLGALALSMPVMLLLALPLADGIRRARRYFTAEAFVLLGTLCAWGVSAWKTLAGGGAVYFETATMVIVLYSLGRWLDVRARRRSSAALAGVVAASNRSVARLTSAYGSAQASAQPPGEELVSVEELVVGDVVRLRPGDVVPLDGRVVAGRSFVDTSSLSGEEEPVSLGPGDRALGGWSLSDGSLEMRVEAPHGACVQDEVERLLFGALREPPRLVRVADRVAGALLPLVVLLACATAVVRTRSHGLETGLFDALSVVLISCPCALGLATPLAFWAALGSAWKAGVLVRGADVLERLARARRVFFDKTGTLTSGELSLESVRTCAGLDAQTALYLAARLELASEHPIGRALVRAAGPAALAGLRGAEDFRLLPGVGVEGRIDERLFVLRRERVAHPPDADDAEAEATGATSRVELVRLGAAASSEEVLARFELSGEIRPESPALVAALRARGLDVAVLTGDAPGPARALAKRLAVPVHAELLPGDKVEALRRSGRAGSVFVGDGLNDSAALAAADVGIAVESAAPKSLAAADIQLLGASPAVLPALLDLARHAVRTARLNLVWAFGYNAIGLWLAVAGRLTPIFAALAMVASSLIVVVGSSRLARRSLTSEPGSAAPARLPVAHAALRGGPARAG